MSPALALVGGGNMGEALLRGLLAAGRPLGSIRVVEAASARRQALAADHAGLTVVEGWDEVGEDLEGAILAVKPADIATVAARASRGGASRLLSVAAGVSTAALEAACPAGTVVLRAMPNTPALVGAGASALCGGTAAGPDDVAWAEEILGSVGTVTRLPESLFDAVTGLSGSGPAYVFLVVEALIDAGVSAGLARDVSAALATQTLLGAARLLSESGRPAESLRAMVTSPGGTTAAGLRVLEARAVRAAFIDAVAAAADRSRQLG